MSMGWLHAETPAGARCKCCGATAYACGAVDFHKNCEDRRARVLEPSGVPIPYLRCPSCRFLFTTVFDGCSHDDLRLIIYNDQYALVDPDARESRPRTNADTIGQLFPAGARPSRILDYGGGHGLLGELLRGRGFPEVDTYDPFVPRHARKPSGPYDCILCFEVLEHATDPAGVLAEIAGLLADPGLVLFSTLLQPPDIDDQGLGWWYVGPRNGHVSLFSRASLEALVHPLDLAFASFNDAWHVLLRGLPAFARHLLRKGA